MILLWGNEGARLGRWSPRDSITANGVSVEDVSTPLTIIYLQNDQYINTREKRGILARTFEG